MNLVVDSSVAVAAASSPLGFAFLRPFILIAPPLLWIEANSVLHRMMWHNEIEPRVALAMRARLNGAPIRRDTPATLGDEAWTTADEMGWARTYDANYVALARLRGCRLVTLDERLRRGTDRLGFVVVPGEL